MRKLIVTENISLDGVIDATGNWFLPSGAQDPDDVAEMAAVEREQRSTADAVLLGRLTFEAFREYWPAQTDDTTGVSDYLNRVHKYVVSSTLTDPEWDPATVLRGPVRQEVAALKETDGGDVVATGSLQLVADLVGSGLVDEYRLFVYPVTLGNGARLFPDGLSRQDLTLVDAQAFASGVALLTYRP